MADIFLSSDHHFHHANIIKFCDRPFKDVQEMNEALVDLHNQWVKPADHWYCLGDVTIERDNQGRGLGILTRMNGHKRLILGNHDHYAMRHYLQYFEKVFAVRHIDNILMSHIPIHPASMSRWRANVHGHIHNNQGDAFQPVTRLDPKTGHTLTSPYINVSVEVLNYHPISLDEIKTIIAEMQPEGC